MTRPRKRLVVACILLALVYIGWAGYVRFGGPAVQNNTFVGRTESRLHWSYGEPDKDWQGYQSLGGEVPPSLPPGSIRTLIFHPRGLRHPEGGTLWVWIVERGNEWVCFESCWFAAGVAF